jgi:hypothetical protein
MKQASVCVHTMDTNISVLMPLIIVDQEDVDVSQDDFSGPEAELRYRSFQVHMAEPAEELLPDDPEVEHEIMPAQVEPPPLAAAAAANQNVSLRRRARKQAAPLRAPFF